MSVEFAEKQFREVERALDELLRKAEGQLRSLGISIEDHSARTYHYKNDHLVWCFSFRKEWLVDIEKARVMTRLSYSEPVSPSDAPEIKVSWRAEAFRQGQESRIDKRNEKSYPLHQVQQEGISHLVTTATAEGSQCLQSAL